MNMKQKHSWHIRACMHSLPNMHWSSQSWRRAAAGASIVGAISHSCLLEQSWSSTLLDILLRHLLCNFWEDFLIFSLLKIFISWCCCSFKSCSQCCPHLFQLIYLPCTATWLPPTFTKCLIKKSVASDTVCMVGRIFSNISFNQLFLFFGSFFWERLKVTFPHNKE